MSVTKNGKITQAQKTPGVSGFAKNGTIVQYGESGYARLNKGGNVDWLPNNSSQDQIANALAVMGQFFGGNSASTWTQEEFPQITNNGGSARNDFDASSWNKKFADDKLFNLDMGSFVQPGKLPDRNSFGERFNAFSEGIKNLFDVGGSFKSSQGGLNSMTVKVTSLDSVRQTGFTREKDTTIFIETEALIKHIDLF